MLLLDIAQKSMRINTEYAKMKESLPRYQDYEKNVVSYFDNIAKNPVEGITRLLSDIQLDQNAQDQIIEQLAISLIERQQMSPEARALYEAQTKKQALDQQLAEQQKQLEQMQAEAWSQQQVPVYSNYQAEALKSVGFDTQNPAVINAMTDEMKNYVMNERQIKDLTPLTAQEFNYVAQRLAHKVKSFNMANTNKPQPKQNQVITKPKGFVNPNAQPAQKPNGKFVSESDFMKQIGVTR
jgi:hypothetical protein